jgi:hypothetical protein
VPAGERGAAARALDRVASGFLLALMALGSFALWLGVPALCLYASGKVAHSGAEHYLLALPMTVAGMLAWGLVLIWLNNLYLRVTGVIARYRAEEEEFGAGSVPRFLRGPLEPLLIGSLVIALIVLTAWFLFIADGIDPGSSVAP